MTSANRRRVAGISQRIFAVVLLAVIAVIVVFGLGLSRAHVPQMFAGGPLFVAEGIVAAKDDVATVQRELARAQTRLGLTGTVFGRDGRVIATTAATIPPPLSEVELSEVRAGKTDVRAEYGAYADHEGRHALVHNPSRIPRLRDVLIDLLFVLVCLGGASWLLARMVSRPVDQVAQAARSFGRGDLFVRAKLQRTDELGDLSHTFDEMADRITQLLRTQRELMGNVSHELRTPMSRIRVALDLAADGDNEEARQSLRDIAEDIGELEDLVNDVLAMARFETETTARAIPRLRTEVTSMRLLVDKAATRFRAGHPERSLGVTLPPESAGGLELEADQALLRRVVENLLENAHKYSGEGSNISLSLTVETGRARVVVADDGNGIAADDLPHVFEPFFRADRSRTRGKGGTGLGLSLSKKIVEAHGGTIQIKSALGQGTAVTFEVPLLPAASGA